MVATAQMKFVSKARPSQYIHCMIPDSWPSRKLLALYNENQLADYENDH